MLPVVAEENKPGPEPGNDGIPEGGPIAGGDYKDRSNPTVEEGLFPLGVAIAGVTAGTMSGPSCATSPIHFDGGKTPPLVWSWRRRSIAPHELLALGIADKPPESKLDLLGLRELGRGGIRGTSGDEPIFPIRSQRVDTAMGWFAARRNGH